MAEKVASLYAEISADTSKLQTGLGTVRSEMKTTTDAAGKLKDGLSSVSGLKFTELASAVGLAKQAFQVVSCLLYTSDAADDLLCVVLGGRRVIKKNNK